MQLGGFGEDRHRWRETWVAAAAAKVGFVVCA
jgi:hypothetical protein